MPRAVVHCQTGDDVRLAIRAAPDRGLPLSARAGGRDRTSKPPLNVRKEFPNERDRKAGGVLPRLSTRRSKPSPLTVLLSTTLALWLLVYLVAGVAEAHHDAGAGRVASVTFIEDRPAAYSPIARDTSARTFSRRCATADN